MWTATRMHTDPHATRMASMATRTAHRLTWDMDTRRPLSLAHTLLLFRCVLNRYDVLFEPRRRPLPRPLLATIPTVHVLFPTHFLPGVDAGPHPCTLPARSHNNKQYSLYLYI